MCTHDWLQTSYSKVCCVCGVERPVLRVDTFSLNSAPLDRGYNRRQRFKVKVDKLLGLHSGPTATDPVWTYLQSQKAILTTPASVRYVLRMSGLKNKHYDCMRIFCDAFTQFSVQHNQLATYKYLMDMFDSLFMLWNTYSDRKGFFSYAWLLRYFLTRYDSSLLVYLKPQTCKSRHSKYLSKLAFIRSRRSDGIPHYDMLDIHLPNA